MNMLKFPSDAAVYAISDTHFNHMSICGPKLTKWDKGYRNFESLEQMEDTIVNNLNSVVREQDTLIHVGDVIMGHKPAEHLPRIMQRINCNEIHLVYGNHDDRIRENVELQGLFTSVQEYLEVDYAGQFFCIMHYPMGSWNKIGKGAINLHGHSHGTYTRTYGKQKDIGVDTNGFYPYHLSNIIAEMAWKPVESPDHHSSKTSYH